MPEIVFTEELPSHRCLLFMGSFQPLGRVLAAQLPMPPSCSIKISFFFTNGAKVLTQASVPGSCSLVLGPLSFVVSLGRLKLVLDRLLLVYVPKCVLVLGVWSLLVQSSLGKMGVADLNWEKKTLFFIYLLIFGLVRGTADRYHELISKM